jgi:MFS family permease
MIPDRYSPARVFFVSAILASAANASIFLFKAYEGLFLSRFLVGFFLAGIYPVGMKIVTDWNQRGVGRALGYLVGALVLGTALPHFINSQSMQVSWRLVIGITSALAVLAGVIVLFLVGDGPYRQKSSAFDPQVFRVILRNRNIRDAALGYFGHMWELYAFWALIPVIIRAYNLRQGLDLDVSLWSFFVIGIGALGCVTGGILSLRAGSARVAFTAMLISGLCCILSLLSFSFPPFLFLTFLLIWGFTVIMDSAQFSSLVAQYSEKRYLGSALTIVTSLGFATTIVSIRIMDWLLQDEGNYYWVLALGPLLALIPMGRMAFSLFTRTR